MDGVRKRWWILAAAVVAVIVAIVFKRSCAAEEFEFEEYKPKAA